MYDTFVRTPSGMTNLLTGVPWDAARLYGFPWAGNTGPTGPLTPTVGPIIVSDSNVTLENLDIDGYVLFENTATNGTIRNCRITSGGFWPCQMLAGGTIEDTEIAGGVGSQACLYMIGVEAARLNLHGAGDGVRFGASSLVDSYVHDMADFEGVHIDATEVIGPVGGPNRLTGNSILNRAGQTSCVMMSEWGVNPDVDTIIDSNLIAGGGYSIYGYSPGTDVIAGLQVINNKFSTMFFPNSGFYGPVNVWPGSPNVWNNNTWIDGPNVGNPITP